MDNHEYGSISLPSSVSRAVVFCQNCLPLAHKSAIYGEGSGLKCQPEGPKVLFRRGIGHFRPQKSAIFGETFAGASWGLSKRTCLNFFSNSDVAWRNHDIWAQIAGVTKALYLNNVTLLLPCSSYGTLSPVLENEEYSFQR
jgi:hypothetical protein